MNLPLLAVDVTVGYPGKPRALDRAAFSIGHGETVGLIGQSGSGKSTIALAILRLLGRRATVTGSLRLEGRDLLALPESQMRGVRGREIGLVLQSPATSMNPVLRLEQHLEEAWRAHGKRPWKQERERVCELLVTMGLPADRTFLRRYPGQISIGQAQRVMIAAAILHRPRLLIADEPTSALDAFTQAEVLALLRRLNQEMAIALLFISHDLACVASLCEHLLIIDQGKIVESGRAGEIFAVPAHPATRRLVESAAPGRQPALLTGGLAALAAATAPETSRQSYSPKPDGLTAPPDTPRPETPPSAPESPESIRSGTASR
jgi:ABC-type dipeptide/oligopeptide/nickel transport system ATPase component